MYATTEAQVLGASESGGIGWVLGIGLAVLAVAVVGMLVWVVRKGIQTRAEEPEPPTPESQPHKPARPTHEEDYREDDVGEFPTDGGRLLPHELKGVSSHQAEPPEGGRPKHTPGHSGGFGSGGAGG
ncbi:DUF6479 family protein [Streptomyces albidoflavus]|uniref:DUF6479 family protein n=1 Tax=Streptomyces albidoflavus TaxID=1886 RepID=UPI001022451F|nr:DUF6479 family protein [Streptomyces albidoflavus]RZE75457.1 hypothetical protein C0R02_22770 [Streptomyces albidoflavus]WST10670.1 DUF6479 family protein [Streptomyces albidoflavus]WTC41395.1 DUF6479 family protein [Streptomyces albidoflavus]WTD44183.1 DUF6479 family protein [Streptomyces albidoflavus]WTD81548.1 DUF6479 family protein [Streptomyces albidoflavus]